MIRYILLFVLLTASVGYAEPRVRPESWARPIIGTHLDNLFLVDNGVYRSKQPKDDDIDDLRSLGIKEVLSLREYHDDRDYITDTRFHLHRIKIDTAEITEGQIIEALKIIKNKQGPILIHCWHGSDRTGVIVATYRIIFNNWTKSQALDEMVNGGYGYHASVYPGLVKLVEGLDIERIRQALE